VAPAGAETVSIQQNSAMTASYREPSTPGTVQDDLLLRFGSPSMMPGALIEPLFITDPFKGSIAASGRGQQVIAAGLARAIQQYFAGANRVAPSAR
jgi:N-acetylmuramoyl-L-alanine amidase